VTDRRDSGSDFRFEATIQPDEDPKEAEIRWYRWSKEEKHWEFYGNKMPSWEELSERNRDSFTRAYDFIFRSYYEKKRSEAIE
jgi:hypothetical protein